MDLMEKEDFLHNLDSLIRHIIDLHSKASEGWSKTYSDLMIPNLKKKQVRDLVDDDLFFTMILKYRSLLLSTNLDSTIRRYEREEFEIKCRIKVIDSVQSKIERYIDMEHEGRVPVNKCINDIFGVRVIANCTISHEEICRHVFDTHGLKCIDSSKTDPRTGRLIYIATHIYFKDGNMDFPWELQIWFTENSESNYASHEKHKQRYTKWSNNNGDPL